MRSFDLPDPRRAIAILLLAALPMPAPIAAAATGELVLETENDFLTSNQTDDLYTFSLTLGWNVGESTLRLRENAFTDRRAGLRFDETHVTLGRELRLGTMWTGRGEAGVVRVGRGLFGESAQNAVHRLIGDPEVQLEYIDDDDVHPYGRFELERIVVHGPSLASGPVFELQAALGFKSSVLAGWKVDWTPDGPFAFELTAGHKWADTELDHLAPWISSRAAFGVLEIVFRERLVLSWSYDAYGTAREHVAIGYRFAAGR